MAEDILKLNETISKGICILEIGGELDANTSPSLMQKFESIISKGQIKIVCDCSNLDYISSAGIGVLNATLNKINSKGGNLVLSCVNKLIKDTLNLMYFTKKVRIYKSNQDAMKDI